MTDKSPQTAAAPSVSSPSLSSTDGASAAPAANNALGEGLARAEKAMQGLAESFRQREALLQTERTALEGALQALGQRLGEVEGQLRTLLADTAPDAKTPESASGSEG
ncbi:hypothetical protein E3E12_01320 [Formicincola oecophyllae]|uniref:Uncharacterized protein n=1 Tax=Formicincola oecophyllae TaxID=2558361 RepID=A0A4Y6U6R6_9PROT|nr:hypothetical protein [Formicincola oecophyllae]QDH13059.1 hypothetical protein E3E12_01320 [Formicincola oecophyllae]